MSEGVPNRPEMVDYQERLRALTLKLIWAEEKERRRISMGLHDDLGQSLALAKVKIRELCRITLHTCYQVFEKMARV